MALNFDKITNTFLRMHLDYVYDTQPPRLFHLWSAIVNVAACMQRHLYLDTGIGKIYGNMYVLLVGPPATKKNTAIKFARDLVAASTTLRFAPDDTGGQRQGLMTAMVEDDEMEVNAQTVSALDPDALMSLQVKINDCDRHVLFATATEFGSFIGQNNSELLRFLIKVWDGEDYRYQLQATKKMIKEPLLTIAGATTASDIAELMPPQAIGQGFTSRIVFVYAGSKEKTVPLNRARLKRELEPALQQVYSRTFYDMRGAVVMDDGAARFAERLEMAGAKIYDTRFIYYAERRVIHLAKLAMVMAVSRGSMVITQADVEEAHMILSETEKIMPDALGEYGMEKIAVARQKMLEFLRYAEEPVSEKFLYAIMRRDMKMLDFKNSLAALIHADKIVPMDLETGRHYVFKDDLAKNLQTMDAEALNTLLLNPGE